MALINYHLFHYYFHNFPIHQNPLPHKIAIIIRIQTMIIL